MSEFQLPARRRIFLMRHGDVTYFDDSGRAIDPDTVPLNEHGREQASAAGRAFAAQDIRFDRVIVSGLRRTVETAERVLEETRQIVEMEVQPAWQEIRGGRLGAIPAEQMENAFLRVFDGVVPESTQFLGGETIGELLDRVLPQMDALRADPSWDTVLLVLHGGVNRALLSHAITAGGRAFFGHLAQATGCINALDVGAAPHDWVVRALNHAPPSPLHRDVRNTTMEMLYAQYVRYRPRN
ncbi:histidine phosphatase family protein [Paraburkholderia caballeronis]|uniref:Probable phosphoglycerate mutase n=1 Tax=Paraburkholderia caballeronis TaxID=416943 RepID=A0A1H7TEC7_9BURK|nr:histidine phosphatase family protein [Paraburkholderia caballeronis]PXW22618.1 putative phosphoglycerate mutase [Paraburkholderia caballeronis]PXW96721.1 putative phosphoglycerate mutase [Paraburkholderia caballeronis]RAJ93348.1 putative phosphoglycerate mutase [Paraburkholderia caballeronis]TDV32700.1 putative phosphoglycerate mutase [Paraburkholderia caballeronis]SEC67117.1 probable phosphoglycerate mutase [Paraburkholderia caballeronis]